MMSESIVRGTVRRASMWCVAMIVACSVFTHAAQAPSAAATWTGSIDVPPQPLQVAVILRQDAATGAWSGRIDIPAQGAKGLPLANVRIDGRSATFAIAGVPGNPTFAGTLSEDGEGMAGTFSQGSGNFTFELRRTGPPTMAAAPARPQEPTPPFPYREELVTYRNDAANIALAGTLTLPRGAGRFPAVLLISGSGPQDRDSTMAGHKPFLLLADTLTRRGIAVLRVDDRGVGGSERGTIEPTSADLAGDVRAGIAFLRARADIDAARVGLIGHSEGGIIAPMVAADDPRVRFIVMLAGYGLRGDEVMMQQVKALARAQGVPDALIDWDLAMRRRVYDVVIAEADGKPDEAARQALIENMLPFPGPPGLAAAARETAQLLLRTMSTPWWRYMLAYDPAPALARVRVPVLALIGSHDRQVPAAENLAAIRRALDAGGNRDATVRELPALNHRFQTSQTGLPTESASIEETMAPSALSLVVEWVVERAK